MTMTTALTLTGRDIVNKALQEIRVIALGEEPRDHEMAAGLQSLAGMIKSLQAQGLLWQDATGTVTLDPDQVSGTLPHDVRSITGARVVPASGATRMIWPYTAADYRSLPNKSQSGVPVAYYLDRQRDAAVFYVWPVPTTTTNIEVDYVRALEISDDGIDPVDIPDDWSEAIWTNLALRLSGTFGAELPAELVSRAGSLMAAMMDDSRPDSYNLAGWGDYA